jgi:hypothetical protein
MPPTRAQKAVREKIDSHEWHEIAEAWGVSEQTVGNWANGKPIVHCDQAARHERVSVDDFRAGRWGPAYESERQAIVDDQARLRTVAAIIQDAAATDDPELKARKLAQAESVGSGRTNTGIWGDARTTTSVGAELQNPFAYLAELLERHAWRSGPRVFPTPPNDERAG